MSVEAFAPEHGPSNEEVLQGIEKAVSAISQIRILLAQQEKLIEIERANEVPNLGILSHATQRISELSGQLEDNLAFLEHFDPRLYQELKD